MCIRDSKHTFLLAYLSLGALIYLFFRRSTLGVESASTISAETYVAWWLLTLLATLSFLPISLDPLLFVGKQSNYLNLFLAPMAILGGTWLAQLPKSRWRNGLVSIAVLGGIALGAFEQAAYQVFTANSKAAVELAIKRPNAMILGSVNNANIATIRSILDSDFALAARFLPISDGYIPDVRGKHGQVGFEEILIIVDRENQGWGTGAIVVDKVPECWIKLADLQPTGMGLGSLLVQGVRLVIRPLPENVGGKIDRALRELMEPEVATVYHVNGASLWCGSSQPGVSVKR